MNQNDLAIAVGGVSAPLWLLELNQWVALVVGVLSICYLCFKLYEMWKKTNGTEK